MSTSRIVASRPSPMQQHPIKSATPYAAARAGTKEIPAPWTEQSVSFSF